MTLTQRPDLHLALAALSIGLIFGVALILPLPFWLAQPSAPAASTGGAAATDLGWPAVLLAVGFALALCVPFRPYLLALRAATHARVRSIVILTAVLALIALLIYPAYGSDLFVYLDYERLWAVYGLNPVLAFPALRPDDWAFRFVWIPQQVSPYGPLWPIVSWPIARLAGDSLWGWIIGYKLLSVGSYLICCGFIWASVEDARRRRAVILFAWSPLVLFEVLGKAHNDSLLTVSALAAVWLARKHPIGGMLAATAGALLKISGLAVVLGLALYLARSRAWRQLILGAIAACGVTLAVYAPFWAGVTSLQPLLFQTGRVVWSPGALFIALGTPDLLVRGLGALTWAGVCGYVARNGRELARDGAVILLGTLLLLTTAFFAHYLVPVIALCALAGSRRLEQLVLLLSIGSLAAYSVELLAVAAPAGWIGSPAYQALGSALTVLPAGLLTLRWCIGDRHTLNLAIGSRADVSSHA